MNPGCFLQESSMLYALSTTVEVMPLSRKEFNIYGAKKYKSKI